MSKEKYSKRMSKHHIIPSSRGGSSDLENISKIEKKSHECYHYLFGNKMPFEIVEELATKYWNGDWSHVKKSQMVYNRH